MSEIEARNFTYCQAYYRPLGYHEFVVMTPAWAEARQRAEAYATARWGTGAEICLYPRKYIRDARTLYAAGKHD